MQYACRNCGNRFEGEDGFRFCPYCGKALEEALDDKRNSASDRDLDVAGTIDFIWGEEAKLRKDFSHVIVECMHEADWHSSLEIEMTLPGKNLTQFEEVYKQIEQSSNRKVLLHRVDDFVKSLAKELDELQDEVPEDKLEEVSTAIRKKAQKYKVIYQLLGLDYAGPTKQTVEEIRGLITLVYTKEELLALYDLVLVAYEKYKRCVEDNNMFAAFSSDSDYGAVRNGGSDTFPRYRQAHNQVETEAMGRDEAEKVYQEITDYMCRHNEEKYMGMLDEDFAPHVDAFWHGLKVLCKMIDNRFFIAFEEIEGNMDKEERARIMRLIAGRTIEVNAEKVEKAFALKKQLEAWDDDVQQ